MHEDVDGDGAKRRGGGAVGGRGMVVMVELVVGRGPSIAKTWALRKQLCVTQQNPLDPIQCLLNQKLCQSVQCATERALFQVVTNAGIL